VARTSTLAPVRQAREDRPVNDCVYIHECIPIEGGGRGKMIEMIRSRWAPHVERVHGVRLVGVWAEVGSTAAWPQVRVQWEMDDWDHFARAQAGQYPMEERDVFVAELWNQALEYRRGGHSSLLRPAPFSPDRATIEAERTLFSSSTAISPTKSPASLRAFSLRVRPSWYMTLQLPVSMM